MIVGLGGALVTHDTMPLHHSVAALGAPAAVACMNRLRRHALGAAPARFEIDFWVAILRFLSFSPRGGLLTMVAFVIRHAPLLPRIA